MKESSIVGEVLHVGIFVIVAAVVVLAGWNEPLRYLFLKPDQIAQEEHTMFAAPVDQRWNPQSSLRGTALDRAPYKTLRDGTIQYSNDFDSREMGTRTEVKQQDHIYNRAR